MVICKNLFHMKLCITWKTLYDIATILLDYRQSRLGDFNSLSLHPETVHITKIRVCWVVSLASLTGKTTDTKIYEKLTTEVSSLC